MFNVVKARRWFFLLSALIIIPGFISLIVPPHLKPGLEFQSGTMMTVAFSRPAVQGDLRRELSAVGYGDAVIQHTPKEGYLFKAMSPKEREALQDSLNQALGRLRLEEFPASEGEEAKTALIPGKGLEEGAVRRQLELRGKGDVFLAAARFDTYLLRTRALSTEDRQRVEQGLTAALGPLVSYDVYSVSPLVAGERVRYAVYAIIAASAAILLYITWAFRHVPSPFRYGVCAVIAIIHDVLVVLGIFSLLGRTAGMEINSMFITGILTVIGYSVHDTIVVFDRLRENITRYPNLDFETTVNHSVLETMGRSLNTSLTTLIILAALFLFGGVTLRGFVLVLLIGIITGTYSSIFVAAQLLVEWESGTFGRLRRRLSFRRAPVPAGR